jgi:hypothetical protein
MAQLCRDFLVHGERDGQAIFGALGADEKELLWIEESNQRSYAYNHFWQHPERLIGWFDRYIAESGCLAEVSYTTRILKDTYRTRIFCSDDRRIRWLEAPAATESVAGHPDALSHWEHWKHWVQRHAVQNLARIGTRRRNIFIAAADDTDR